MNKIAGYRTMLGKTQKEMANLLGIGEVSYRNKEKGKVDFKESEILSFYLELKKVIPNISLEDIFLNSDRRKVT